MKAEIIKPERIYKILHAILVDDQWIIEIFYTVMGSLRVTIREKDSYDLMCNWCAGPDPHHVVILVNVLLDVVASDDLDVMPFASERKPYFKDEKFMAFIEGKTTTRLPSFLMFTQPGFIFDFENTEG